MPLRVPIRWRSTWITCDFPRLWSALPVSPQTALIWWLLSESPINTSADMSYLPPSKSKWVQRQLEYGTEYENSYPLPHLSASHLLCLSEICFFVVLFFIRLSLVSGCMLWSIRRWGKLISSDSARGRKGQPWHAGLCGEWRPVFCDSPVSGLKGLEKPGGSEC